ncbi:MAG: C4-dicarboxylate ABC transporter permease [Alteromonadaceae bacterium]|nr:MAG: C4-dicarboxylate ABC transporter permease [Alteromonadaceae bacterium]
MPKIIVNYVNFVEGLNRKVGRAAMYLVFVMMAVLLYSAVSRSLFNTPLIWSMEVAQFTMAAYYLLGGGYTLQNNAHVRMDLLYERWAPKKQAFVNTITACCLIFYLCILLYGAYSSTEYALEYEQKNYSSWGPPMAPIKIIMSFGIFLMLLQAVAIFFRDLAAALGKDLP